MAEKKIPTIQEFENMDIDARAEFLFHYGVFFDQQVEFGKKIWKYYLLFDRVVELEYDMRQNRIWDILVLKQFTSGGLSKTDQQ